MGSLEDELKKWKKQAPASPAASSAPSSKPGEPQRKKATKKDPAPLHTLRREEPKRTSKTDAELFAEAVDAVDDDAVLEKFQTPVTESKKQKAPAPPPPTDEQMFEAFVGADVVKTKKK